MTPGSQYVVHVPVTFTPVSPGTVTSDYQVTWTDAAGTHALSVPLTGTGVAPSAGIAVPPPGGGWRFTAAPGWPASPSASPGSGALAGSAGYSVPEPRSALPRRSPRTWAAGPVPTG